MEVLKEAKYLDMCNERVINSAIKGLTIYEGSDRVEIVASVLEVLGGVGSSTWDLVGITLETSEFIELFNGNEGFDKLTCKGATAQVNKMKVTDGVDVMDVWRCVKDPDSGLAAAVVKSMINSLTSVDDAVLFYNDLPKELKKIEVLTALITGMISVSTPPSIVAQTLNVDGEALKDIVDDVLVDVLCNARGYEDIGINALRAHGDIYDSIRGSGRARIKIEQVRRRRRNRDFMKRRGWNEVKSGFRWWGGGEEEGGRMGKEEWNEFNSGFKLF